MEKETNFHAWTIERIFQHFKTSPKGLSADEVKARLVRYGKNSLREEKINALKILVRQFNNILIYILLAASLVSISIGEWTDFVVINCIIIANGLIGFWQECKAESSIAALKKLTESQNKVVRGGKLRFISSKELVPGDYVILHEGEIVTADIRIVESRGLMVDEATLTGESVPAIKDHTAILPEGALPYELENMVLSGTVIVRGAGKGVVVRTGNNTYVARIAEKSQEKPPESPLTKALQHFAKGYLIVVITLFMVLGIIGYLQGRSLLTLGYILIAALVSAVPEGLPIVITLVMVIGAIALSKKKSLIRHLPSVETLGSATVIASDKTGTITEGKLTVKESYTKDEEKLKLIAALCNDAHEESGDPMDVALAKWVQDYKERRGRFPRKWSYPFDANLRLMATLHDIDNEEVLLVKGAYEALQEHAESHDKEMEAYLQSFVQKGLRVLAFGMGKGGEEPSTWKITIIGLIGFLDPPKKGVIRAVEVSKRAGIRVIMITGDHPLTGKAIAEEVGIFRKNDKILTGKEIETLDDEELIDVIPHTSVFARILPEHKYRLVKLLQEANEIVAVTGDGVNDVPALKAADIGIAMGDGTEAAKSVSNMVITDNNLKIITEAIKNGRVIADNLRKVIYYLISTSMMEILLLSFAIFSKLPLPLSAIQILWINIVTGGVQDKMFAFAKAEGDVMTRKPRRPEKQFFDWRQRIRISFFGAATGLLCFFLYRCLLDKYPVEASTIIFTSVVVAQWANGIQAQKDKEPFFKNVGRSFSINPSTFLGIGIGILLQCFVLYVVPNAFHVANLRLEHWVYPGLIFACSFLIVEIRKWTEIFIDNLM